MKSSCAAAYVDLPLFSNAALQLTIALISAAPIAANAQAVRGALPESSSALRTGEWPAYAGTYAAAR
jgi:quinoprotein glucose dehydrogenase